MGPAPPNSTILQDRTKMKMGRRRFVVNIQNYTSKVLIKIGLNGVAVARHGLILGHNGATGSRKLLEYLPALPDPLKIRQNMLKRQQTKKYEVSVCLVDLVI